MVALFQSFLAQFFLENVITFCFKNHMRFFSFSFCSHEAYVPSPLFSDKCEMASPHLCAQRVLSFSLHGFVTRLSFQHFLAFWAPGNGTERSELSRFFLQIYKKYALKCRKSAPKNRPKSAPKVGHFFEQEMVTLFETNFNILCQDGVFDGYQGHAKHQVGPRSWALPWACAYCSAR